MERLMLDSRVDAFQRLVSKWLQSVRLPVHHFGACASQVGQILPQASTSWHTQIDCVPLGQHIQFCRLFLLSKVSWWRWTLLFFFVLSLNANVKYVATTTTNTCKISKLNGGIGYLSTLLFTFPSCLMSIVIERKQRYTIICFWLYYLNSFPTLLKLKNRSFTQILGAACWQCIWQTWYELWVFSKVSGKWNESIKAKMCVLFVSRQLTLASICLWVANTFRAFRTERWDSIFNYFFCYGWLFKKKLSLI